MIDTSATQLYAAVSAVAPIDGVSIGDKLDKSTWRVDFHPDATPAQKTAAQQAIASFVLPLPIDPEAGVKAALDAYINRVAPPVDPMLKTIMQEWRKLL